MALKIRKATNYIGTKGKTFGNARVECHPEVETPFRTGGLILLPTGKSAEIIDFPGQNTFLMLLWDDYFSKARGAYFGGMDESPFLSRLDWDKVHPKHWRNKGSEAFFEILKPNVTTTLEGSLSVRSKRQGDWFATPLPVRSIEEGVTLLSLADALSGGNTNNLSTLSGNTHALMGTRHALEGEAVKFESLYIGRGTLRAPDHADQHFDGIHLFEQADAFYNEETARNAD